MITALALSSLLAQSPPLTIEVRPIPVASTSTATPEQLKIGQSAFTIRCTMCHGRDGNADTPMGRAMKPAPARFSNPLWQATTSDDAIREIVTLGGAALKRSPAMPAAKDLKPGELDALVAFVRSLRAPLTASVTVKPETGNAVVVQGATDAAGAVRIVVPDVAGAVHVEVVDSAGRTCSLDVPKPAGATIVCPPPR